jgi:hypothetical protein
MMTELVPHKLLRSEIVPLQIICDIARKLVNEMFSNDSNMHSRNTLCLFGTDTINQHPITPMFNIAPCHHGMAHPQVPIGGGGLQTWILPANILKRKSLEADKECSSSCGVRCYAEES